MLSLPIQEIINSIKNGKCVLVVGPDLVDFSGKQFFEILCEAMSKNRIMAEYIDFGSNSVFVHEELLHPKNRTIPITIYDPLQSFYNSLDIFNEPFKKISEIPFNLIISFLPDDRLKNIFETQGLQYQYAYHSKQEANLHPQLKEPQSSNPIIYNILGDIDNSDAIITFDDMFLYLSNTIGGGEKFGIFPKPISNIFKKAHNFLFLGVHFEKWYFQLLLKAISQNETNIEKQKYTLLRNTTNNLIYAYSAERLNFKKDFLDIEPTDFLNQIYDECKSQNLLKRVFSKPKTKLNAKKVFISYSHQDKTLIAPIVEQLRQDDEIEVFIDGAAMSVGERIKNYMQRVAEMSTIIVFVSQNSLSSAYVGKEISIALDKNINIVPCHLDNKFIEKTIVDEIKKRIFSELDIIENLRVERKLKDRFDNCTDLTESELLWQDYGKNLDEIINNLQGRKSLSINEHNFIEILKQHVLV